MATTQSGPTEGTLSPIGPPTPTSTSPSVTPTPTPTPPTTSSTTSAVPPPPPPNTSTSLTPSTTTTSTTLPTTSSSSTTTTSTTTSLISIPTDTSTTAAPVVTITSVVTTSSSRNVAPTNSAGGTNSGSSNGFFHNTGAVAGVFTVVGLIVLAILIALITNGIRRRRARKFDDEIAAAARDAANAQIPNFAYDDEDDFRPGAYGASGGNGTKFSDASHGTYAQPPMSLPSSYGMRELPHHGQGPNVGEYFDGGNYGPPVVAGAAGIGVARARSMRDGAYAAGLKEGTSPYAAFAAPVNSGRNPGSPGPQYPPGMIRANGGPEFDLSRRPSQYTQQTDYSVSSRNKSLTATTSSAPSYQTDHYQTNNGNGAGAYGQQQGYPNSFGAYANGKNPGPGPGAPGTMHQPIPPSHSEENLDSAYDGYIDEPAYASHPSNTHGKVTGSPPPGPLPNPFVANGKLMENDDETDDEVEEPRRVLKVANE